MKRTEWELKKICREDRNLITIEVIPFNNFNHKVSKENEIKKRVKNYEVLENCFYIETKGEIH